MQHLLLQQSRFSLTSTFLTPRLRFVGCASTPLLQFLSVMASMRTTAVRAAWSCRTLFTPRWCRARAAATRSLLPPPPRRTFASSPAPPASASSSPSSSSSSASLPSPFDSPSYASIHSKLTSALRPSFLHLEDTSGGCGTFYRVVVASTVFEGLPLVAQHRRVKESIKDDIAAIHGLTIVTMTDAQYKEKKRAQEQQQ